MPSLVDELNELLCNERGEAEAIEALLEHMAAHDSDLVDNARDVLETASWSCSGLYRRITQLHGTPTLDSTDHSNELSKRNDTKSKIEFICKTQKRDHTHIKTLIGREDLDDTTKGFLQELLRAHEDTLKWCKSTLGEWKIDT